MNHPQTVFAPCGSPFIGLKAWHSTHYPTPMSQRGRAEGSGRKAGGGPTVVQQVTHWIGSQKDVTVSQIAQGTGLWPASINNALHKMLRFKEVTRHGEQTGPRSLVRGLQTHIYYYTLTGKSERYAPTYRPRALNDEQVDHIRQSHASGTTASELLKLYQVSESTMYDVMNHRKAYK